MTADAVVRHADPARDGHRCAEIYAPYVCDSVISFETQPPDGPEMSKRIERIAATHPWLVAELGGQLVGYAYGSPHRERAAYRWAADVTVYIDQDRRRQGLGRTLYETLLGLLRRQRMYVACAGITLPNDASVGLHEALGFVPVGVYRNIGWKAGAWHDVGWWQLQLAEPGEDPPAEISVPRSLESA